MPLFGRTAILVVGERQFQTRISFEVAKDKYGKSPNQAAIKVYNLSRDSRDYLESNSTLRCTLAAGYGDEVGLLYSGEIFSATTERNGADIVTTLVGLAGLGVIQRAHFEYSGINNDYDLYRACATRLKSLGVGISDLPQGVESDLKRRQYRKPLSDSGPLAKAISLALHGGGYHWSIDNGSLHVYSTEAYNDLDEVVLSKNTGLIGYPSKSQVGGQKAQAPVGGAKPIKGVPIWKATSLLNPLLTTGRKVILQTEQLKVPNELVVWKVTHRGDTLQGDWQSELEMGKLGSSPYLGPTSSDAEVDVEPE